MLPPKHPSFPAGVGRQAPTYSKYLPDRQMGRSARCVSDLGAVCVEPAALVGLATKFGLGEAVGFSFQPVFLDRPHTGYALSPYPARGRTLGADELTPEAIGHYVTANADMWRSRRHYLGGWLDRETGRFHLDVSIIVQEKCEAEQLARVYKERAYFDIARDKTIYVTSAASHHSRAVECLRAIYTLDSLQPA